MVHAKTFTKAVRLTFFVVIFIGLCAVVLLLVPLIWQLFRENSILQTCVSQTRQDMADTLRNAEHFRLACENARDGIVIQDMKSRIVWSNPAYCSIFGMTPDQIIGRSPLEFALTDNNQLTAEEISNFTFDPNDPFWSRLELVKNRTADGREFWNQINASFATTADGIERAVVVCRDVTEEVETQNSLRELTLRFEHEASHDGLTGVANRASFMTFFEAALNKSDGSFVGLLHIDLDEFKAVNDTHGHSAGDAVLLHTATALRNFIRPSDLVARVGGDEFVVVCPGMSDLAELDVFGNHLIDAISTPFEWSNRTLQNEASIGAVLSSGPTSSPEDLLVQADFALYEAKRAGRNQVTLYDDDLHERQTYLMRRTNELIDAVDTGGLDYYFQPTLDFDSGNVLGFETLVRWTHPQDGVIPPDHFLPLAKDLGLMGAVDLLSMSAALHQKHKLITAGFPDLTIAFNASPELLIHPEFINRLIWGVEAGGIDRAHVTIEVLETTEFGEASENTSHAAIIRDLRNAGFQVHLDDFGVGFAGLSHLATLDVTGVKVDRGLVTGILNDPTSRKIVRKIVELSNDLGLTVIAEGVEDLATATALSGMGCRMIQGYWLSRPMPADDLPAWLARHQCGTAARRA